MKTNIETFFTINNPCKGYWSFYLLPTIRLDYEKDNCYHGKQFVIAIGFLFWYIEIEFNKH